LQGRRPQGWRRAREAAGHASKIKKVLTTAEMAKRYVKGELDPKVA